MHDDHLPANKLTASEEGMAALEHILAGLKNVLTMEGIYFVFIGGPDLYDAALGQRQSWLSNWIRSAN